MRSVIDTEGRIVLPPEMLNEAGLKPGLSVEVELAAGGVSVKAINARQAVEPLDPDISAAHLTEKNGVLVFTGKWTGTSDAILDLIKESREERDRKVMGLE